MAKPTDKPKHIKNSQTENIAASAYVPMPNEKDIAVEKIRKNYGLNVRNEGGILFAYYKKKEDYEDTVKKMEAAVQETGYRGSFGIKYSNGAAEFGET